MPKLQLGPIQARGSIAPGGSIRANATQRAFTADQRKALAEGTKALYAWGEIRYTDAFGAPRRTQFRYRFGGEYGLGTADLVYADLVITEEGNEAD